MSLPGPTQISVQKFTAVRCAVVEFIACTRYDASRLFSRFFVLMTSPLFHPNFWGVLVWPYRPCWGQCEQVP